MTLQKLRKVIFLPGSGEHDQNQFLEQLLREHGLALHQFLRMQLALEEDREDIIQDVFVRLARMNNLSIKFEQRADTVRAYLFAIARNLIRDARRRSRVREVDNHISYDDNILASQQISPEESVASNQKLNAIKTALKKVKARHRKAFLLSRLDNKSYREIGEHLCISVSTVEKDISTVLAVLREELST